MHYRIKCNNSYSRYLEVGGQGGGRRGAGRPASGYRDGVEDPRDDVLAAQVLRLILGLGHRLLPLDPLLLALGTHLSRILRYG